MALIASIRRFMWVVPVMLGLVFIVAGVYMISEGRTAKDEVRSALVAEQVVTAKDASIPGVLVDDVAMAKAQEAIITEHTLGTFGPYSKMDREDPNRDIYLKGVTLRTALNLAVMGFQVSDLVIGVGVFIVLVGATNVLLLAPAMYWAREGAPAGARVPARKPVTPTSQQPAPSGS